MRRSRKKGQLRRMSSMRAVSTVPMRISSRSTEASTEREEILYGTVDPARIENVRRNWPFLRDRRIDAYKGIERRFLDHDLP